MTTATASPHLRPGSTETWYCRPEERTTIWRWGGTQNHSTPCSVTWVCMTRSCGHVRVALADMKDADGFVRACLARHVQRIALRLDADSADLSFDELHQEAWLRLMKIYSEWNPAHGLTFMSYASHLLPLRLIRFSQEQLGRGVANRRIPLVYTEAVDGGLESLVARDAGDPTGDRDPTLLGLVLRGDRGGAGPPGAVGVGARPRGVPRDQEVVR